MPTQALDVQEKPRLISPEESATCLDERAQELLGISGKEFIDRFKRGDYDGIDEPKILELRFLAPLPIR